MRVTVSVALDGAAVGFDKLYSYSVPADMSAAALPGKRVTVPFGRGNRTRQGMIFYRTETAPEKALKEIISIDDETPVLSDEMLRLCEYFTSHLFCTYYDAVNVMLPLGLKLKLKDYYSANADFSGALSLQEGALLAFLKENGETDGEKLKKSFEDFPEVILSLVQKNAVNHTCVPVRNMKDKTSRGVRALCEELPENQTFTARQREVFSVLAAIGQCSVKELEYFTGAGISVINALCEKGAAEYYYEQEFRLPRGIRRTARPSEIKLTDEQQKAYDGLLCDMQSGKAVTSLLYGVTGSGKTQIFLKLADAAIKQDRGVIITVPEIALTPQMIKIFSDRYGDKTAIFHSGLSFGQRMDEYNRVKAGLAKIAIGTRSAIFAPFEDLGLIIIDEEQEHTYKSEKTPRFHARDAARFRAAYNKCLLCLSSATPSMESFALAKAGKHKLYTLHNRYGAAVLPRVEVVDMSQELSAGNTSEISRFLAVQIENRLNAKKQSIILLNRRGHNTYVTCRDCGHVFQCDECSISLTYHKVNGRLMCHYCGASFPAPDKCPECGGKNIKYSGVGTQMLEEQLHLLFPAARILRMDADSTMTRDSYSVKLEAFARGEYDIMLGTQMVAKGLDFPDVTLVGVIGADKAQNSDDYRAFERTFSLLTQVIGRAGRANDEGLAVIQTASPENHIIELARNQDYDAFYAEEIQNRKLMIYPPYCDICLLFCQSVDNSLASQGIKQVAERLKTLCAGEYGDVKIIVLGPCAASVPRVGGKYRYRMIIKCKNSARFRELVSRASDIKKTGDISIGIDINPETII